MNETYGEFRRSPGGVAATAVETATTNPWEEGGGEKGGEDGEGRESALI